MNDLISRQKAIDAFHPDHDTDWYTPWIIETLNEIPSADVVEVVRCKDCKHLYQDNECPLRLWFVHTENDYCSYGERQEA